MNPEQPPRWISAARRAQVRRAMQAVPREHFLPPVERGYARLDCALPIGFGQTVSQPSLVARMTALLELEPGQRVLEVGTGSGYQTAILAHLPGVEVYTIEIIPELAAAAPPRLRALGLHHIHFRCGDGYFGWPEAAPFNAILVTAAPEAPPEPLLAQLAEGGRLVIPLGPPLETQILRRLVRRGADLLCEDIAAVAFVPLTRAPWTPEPAPAPPAGRAPEESP